MSKLPPISLGREEVAEILTSLHAVDDAMQALSFRDYLVPSKLLTSAIEALCEALRGGRGGLCPACGPSTEDIAAQRDEDDAARAAVEGALDTQEQVSELDPLYAGGWVEWNGGDCPLHPDAAVSVRFHGRRGSMTARAQDFMWTRGPTVVPTDIVAYRMVKPVRALVFRNDPPALDTDGPVAVDIPEVTVAPAEMQLLRQLMRGPVFTFHSATIAAATRLRGDGLAMTYECQPPFTWGVEITAKGKRFLDAEGRSDA